MKNYENVFIDLDGTLTYTKPGIVNAIFYALDIMKLPHPAPERMDSFIGPPLIDSFMRECAMTKEQAMEAVELYRVYYTSKGEFESEVYEGVEDMLIRLKAAGKHLYTATSKPEEMARRIIEHFGLDKYFDIIAGASMDESRSDKPQVIRYALDLANITDVSTVIMVGDRFYDIEGANEFGMDSIGVLYGFGSEKELTEHGATYIAKTARDVALLLTEGTFDR